MACQMAYHNCAYTWTDLALLQVDCAAATLIQRMFRGSHVRFFGPRTNQMVDHPLGHETLRINSRPSATGLARSGHGGPARGRPFQQCGIDGLNRHHELWARDVTPVAPSRVTFNEYAEMTDDPLQEDRFELGETEMRDGRDKPSFAFAQAMDAAFSKKPVYKFFDENKPIGSFFDDAIASLSKGKRFSIWDGQSTKIPATAACISIVKTCEVKYKFFLIPAPQPEKLVVAPLVRKTVHCGPVDHEFTVDDLVERLRKLTLLPHTGSVVMAYPVP
jgi:hypothetical protein